MQKLFSTRPIWPIGTALVRIMTGWLIFRYSRELFHIGDLLNFLRDSKFPLPEFSGYAAKIIEMVGGVCLMLGLFTRWITPPLMLTMAGVIYVTANGKIYEAELPFLFLLLFALFFLQGPGKWSLDHYFENRTRGSQKQL
ncbi:MAG: DoxX family protein [Chitinophagaceae bacterium]